MSTNQRSNVINGQVVSDEEKEIYDKLSSFLIDIQEKGEIPIKQAILMGQKRVYYIKGKDLVNYFKEHFEDISNQIKTITKTNIGSAANEKSLQTFFTIFFEKKLLLKLCRIDGDKAKYPKTLLPPKRDEDIRTFEESKFYWINIQQETSKKSLIYLSIAIIIVLLGCMFPVWPLRYKIGFWWAIMAILVFLLILTSLSLIVVIVGLIFGYEIYIMPNLLEPKKSLKDKLFNPFVAYYPREDPWVFIILRICMGISIVALIVIAYLNPAIFTFISEICKGGINKLYSFVKEKIVNNHNASRTSVSRMDRHNKILNEDF